MPVLRSRQVPTPPLPNPSSSSKTLKPGFIEPPSTPAKSTEPVNSTELVPDSPPLPGPTRRRSLRLLTKSNSTENISDFSYPARKRARKNEVNENGGHGDGNVKFEVLNVEVKVENEKEISSVGPVLVDDCNVRVSDETVNFEVPFGVKVGNEKEFNSLGQVLVDDCVIRVSDSEDENSDFKVRRVVKGMEVKTEDKGKGVMIEEEESEDVVEVSGATRRFTREEKGKGILINDDCVLNTDDFDMVTLKLGNDDLCANNNNGGLGSDVDGVQENLGFDDVFIGNNADFVGGLGSDDVGGVQQNAGLHNDEVMNRPNTVMNRFKAIARRNASRFAHFNAREEEVGHGDVEGEGEVRVEEPDEDWPGPFSTAMKIIKDREKSSGGQVRKGFSEKPGKTPLISWTPRKESDSVRAKRAVPSLQELCMRILVKNVDAIASLNYVPDVLRHRLSQMLCDSRRMNGHFFSLLVAGTPSEIRIADCSWLDEDKFEKSFEGCDTSNLTVLQLDLCGHCMSDISLAKAFVPKGLPALTTISLKGACRISDVGLGALVKCAPALRSLNLSQCSLLTDTGIACIADFLGSNLQELYLDECESLDAMRILPALKGLRHLEVLSLKGLGSVSDKFIVEFIGSNGQNMKELIMANCGKLTDSSLKVIGETCSQLCVLDLSHLSKLTDIGMAHVANGCHALQDLKLCRSAFSDDAIAAFLETCGESLRELSLNHITKVGQNTTISIARRCKNLESLDLSWCRSLTDEALGLIADSCLSLRVLKLFGCTQVTKTFLDGHSNPHLQVIGLKLTPILEHIKRPDFRQGPLHYSAVPSL